MTITLHSDPVPLRVDETGTIRVGQTRVTLDVLLDDFNAGMSVEEIVRQLDTLTLTDVHGALAYYFRHRAEVDEYLRQREEEAEKLRQEIDAASGPQLAHLKARMDAFKAQRNAGHVSPPQ